MSSPQHEGKSLKRKYNNSIVNVSIENLHFLFDQERNGRATLCIKSSVFKSQTLKTPVKSPVIWLKFSIAFSKFQFFITQVIGYILESLHHQVPLFIYVSIRTSFWGLVFRNSQTLFPWFSYRFTLFGCTVSQRNLKLLSHTLFGSSLCSILYLNFAFHRLLSLLLLVKRFLFFYRHLSRFATKKKDSEPEMEDHVEEVDVRKPKANGTSFFYFPLVL